MKINVVSNLLGHKDVSTTYGIYRHMVPQEMDEAAEAIGKVRRGGVGRRYISIGDGGGFTEDGISSADIDMVYNICVAVYDLSKLTSFNYPKCSGRLFIPP